MTAFDQLIASSQAQANWTKLENSLTNQAEQVAAAIGLLQRGYLNIKRSLMLAVENYRAAFLLPVRLQPASIQIDVSMDLVALEQAANDAITGLNQVLAGTPTGPVQPRQSCQNVTYQVTQPQFTEVNGQPPGPVHDRSERPRPAAQRQSPPFFLSAATFELEGAPQSGEVELRIATSGATTPTSSARTCSDLSRSQYR